MQTRHLRRDPQPCSPPNVVATGRGGRDQPTFMGPAGQTPTGVPGRATAGDARGPCEERPGTPAGNGHHRAKAGIAVCSTGFLPAGQTAGRRGARCVPSGIPLPEAAANRWLGLVGLSTNLRRLAGTSGGVDGTRMRRVNGGLPNKEWRLHCLRRAMAMLRRYETRPVSS